MLVIRCLLLSVFGVGELGGDFGGRVKERR